MKPYALTRRWDVYLKEGGNTYETVNPQNLRPIFTSTQLTESLWARSLIMPAIQASITMDSKKLLTDIKAHQVTDNEVIKHLDDTDPRWTQSADGLVRHDSRIYVPEIGNLWPRVLQSIQARPHPLGTLRSKQNPGISLTQIYMARTLELCYQIL